MGRSVSRLPSFCLNQIATRMRMRSPPPQSIELKPKIQSNQNDALHSRSEEKDGKTDGGEGGCGGRKVMIVVESSGEAKCALQWALSHAILSSDTLVLLDVVKPSKPEQTENERDLKDYGLLNSMRSICQATRPEVLTELSLVQGKDRGPTIVDEARKQQISLLVLGQKRHPPITWRLLLMWAGSRMVDPAAGSVVDYCVQNSTCMTLAVRRKSRRGGGYLITTRRHKDFWLLA